MMRWSFWSVAVVLFLLLGLAMLFLYPSVQTWLAHELGDRLSREYGITVRIERVELRPFGPNRLKGVFVSDLRGDTLIAAADLRIAGLRFRPRARRIEARSLELRHARFALRTDNGGTTSNLTKLLSLLATGDSTASAEAWDIHCKVFTVDDLHFTFHNGNVEQIPNGVDFDHVVVTRASIAGRDLKVEGDSIGVLLERVSLKERSGLDLLELSGTAGVSPRGIRLADLHLRTPGSDLRGQLELRTESWADFDEFTERVNMRLDLDSSKLQFADVALFAPELHGVDLPIRVRGKFRGTVNELKGRNVDIGFGQRSVFRGSADLSGLPDIDNTFMVVEVEELRTDAVDLEGLPSPPFAKKGRLALPEEVHRLGALSFTGNFTGFISSFTAYGRAGTAAGMVRTDMSYSRDTTTHLFQLAGRLATDGLDMGRIIGSGTLGPMACDVRVNASGRSTTSLKADLEGEVPLFTFNDRSITNIVLNGRLERNLFNGELACHDPKLDLDFKGLADLQGKWPRVDFDADVRHADLRALGLLGGEGYNSLNVRVAATGELAPDSLKGTLRLRDISYCDKAVELALGDLVLSSDIRGGEPVLELNSTVADATVNGTFLPTRLPDALRSVVFSVFPSLSQEVTYAQEEQHFEFDLRVKRAQPLLDLFLPGLVVDPGTHVAGRFDSRVFDLSLEADIPFIRYGALSGDSVRVILDKTLDVLAFSFKSARQTLSDSTYLSGIGLSGKAYQDEFDITAGWAGSTGGTEGQLNLVGQVLGMRSVEADLMPSRLYFGRGLWSNTEVAHLRVDSSTVQVDSLRLWNDGQFVMLNGAVSLDPSKALDFQVRDLRLENATRFFEGPKISGIMSGQGKAFDLYRAPILSSDLTIDSLAIDERRLGEMHVTAGWNESQRHIDVAGTLHRADLKALDFKGKVSPGQEQELEVQLRFDEFDLTFIEPYLPSALGQVSGRITGDVDITGTLSEPLMNGSVMLENAGLKINYLNTRYTFTHRVDIRPTMFAMDFVDIHDEEGNTATAVATIVHHGFKDWNFDVSVDMDKLLVMNTTVSQNELYYGKAYGSGRVQLGGFSDNMELTVDARSEPGTDIHFPLGGSMEVGNISYVRFLNNGLAGDTATAAVDLSGIRLDMDIEVTPDARFELIFDPTVGDVLSGRGKGNLEMTVTPSGEFSMKGDVEVMGGDYLFTLRNLVNKRFVVDPGGHVTWYGDPFDAILSLNAVYKLRTALYDVMLEKSEAYKKRVPVEVVMQLKDKLLNPDITFEVRLPSVDEGVRTQVNSVLSNPDEMNKQVFSLIVMNKFTPPSTIASASGGSGNFAQTTGSELLSNQVSNWLNRISNDFDLGVNYRPGNEITQDELEVAVSTQLFNERLQLSTNVGYQTAAAQGQQNALVGDFAVEYLLSDAGKLRLKAFSTSNDRNLNQVDQAPTTQGVGLGYREEFDTIGEFWRKLTAVFRKEEEVMQEPAAP